MEVNLFVLLKSLGYLLGLQTVTPRLHHKITQ